MPPRPKQKTMTPIAIPTLAPAESDGGSGPRTEWGLDVLEDVVLIVFVLVVPVVDVKSELCQSIKTPIPMLQITVPAIGENDPGSNVVAM